MLNAIWAGMIVLGILYGAFTGNLEAVSNAALESAGEAVDLCITMCGIMGLWTGLMKIAQQAGLIAALTRGISPFVSFLFPRIPKNHPARESISTNIVANVLGLGWVATPAGLKAMEDLAEQKHILQAGSHTSFDAQLPSVFVEIYIRYASSTLIMTPTAVESSAPASVYLDLETRAVIK